MEATDTPTEQLPTACLVCTDDNGYVVTSTCPNPNCIDGLIHPEDD